MGKQELMTNVVMRSGGCGGGGGGEGRNVEEIEEELRTEI